MNVFLAATFLALSFSSSAEELPAARRIVLSCVSAPVCAASGTLLIRPAGEGEPTSVPVCNGLADLPGGVASTSTLELDAHGYWMPPQPLPAPGDQGSTVLRVWRTAPVRGRFKLQDAKDELPKTFNLVFDSPPLAAPAIPSGSSIECPVAPDGSWTCQAPATTLDLILRAKGFTPHYQWDVKVLPNAPPLAAVVLRRGASFVAWIDRNLAKNLEKPAQARLVRMAMADPSPLGQRLTQPVAEAAFNRRGMVQLTGVPPGMYALEVSAPGFATARMENIEIFEQRESSLRRSIELKPPITLTLTLVPASAPSGAPWTVELHYIEPISSQPRPVRGGSFREPGVFEVKGEAPGRYAVTVRDATGNRYASPGFTIMSQADAQQTIEMTLTKTIGTVTLGESPLQATLLFGGNGGPEQIETTSDAEGRFAVTLPRDGAWRVDVTGESSDVAAAVNVTVANHDEPVRIELPDTEVAGWVIGADGARLPRADVLLQTASGIVSKHARADGTFRFRGVAPGEAKIHATDRATRDYSALQDLKIATSESVSGLELSIEGSTDITGVVVSSGQPVVGARVLGYGFTAGSARQERTVTALDGSFKLPIPTSASEVVLLVAAAGRTMQGYAVTGRPRSMTLELAPVGGTLHLAWVKGAAQLRIAFNGTNLPLNDVLLWGRAQGQMPANGAVDIPNLAPGSYRFCFTLPERGGDRCQDGTLAARGMLSLGTAE